MELDFSYSPEIDAWTLRQSGRLDSTEDLEVWRRQLMAQLRRLGGRRAFILIDSSSFTIAPSVTASYGEIVKGLVETYTLGVIRYGMNGFTATQIRLESVINGFPSNICKDRDQAVAELARLRRADPDGSGPHPLPRDAAR